MQVRLVSAILGLALAAPPLLDAKAAPAPASADETAFRALYKQLVEINTTLSVGSVRKLPRRCEQG
jgi:hypothetical protein